MGGRCAFRIADAWLGAGNLYGTGRCTWCGAKISVSQQVSAGGQKPETVSAHCPACEAANDVKVCFSHQDPFRPDPPLDPAMGLPLWLAISTRHGWLWALNAEHLDQLRHLVAARVRETPPGNIQWANRLPGWILAAKNRDEINRALDRLKAKLAT